MEAIQVHSKSWVVRWIDVAEGYSIAWNVQPHKKGVNLGIFKHSGSTGFPSPSVNSSGTFASPLDHATDNEARHGDTKAESHSLIHTLEGYGYKCVSWEGKCEADKITIGRYDVPLGAGGTYGIVLDNTFSRAVAKDVTLAYVIHTTDNAPKFGGLRAQQRKTSSHSMLQPNQSPSLHPESTERTSSIPHITVAKHHGDLDGLANEAYFTGIMYKKRRKKNQGYAKRFFSLDFTSATLSYYRDSRSSALRGAIPLSLASIGIDGRAHEFHIDSGAEVWHVRLRHKKDFDLWKRAFNKVASSPLINPANQAPPAESQQGSPIATRVSGSQVDRDWQRVEALVGRISGSRHALRRLAEDMDPKHAQPAFGLSPSTSINELHNHASNDPDEHPPEKERSPFWRRKPSSGSQNGTPSLFRRVSGQSQTQGFQPALCVQKAASSAAKITTGHGDEIHQRCLALLRDLDATVTEFSSLLVTHKARHPVDPLTHTLSRASIDTTNSREEFYDAEEGDIDQSQIMHIVHSDGSHHEKDFTSDVDSDSSSEVDVQAVTLAGTETRTSDLFPSIPSELLPKSVPEVMPRRTMQPPKQPPPSIIGFLRKNAGKDLSTVAMPVTANEPTSLLQRLAEPLESASLLTAAVADGLTGSDHCVDRLLYVAAFAIAGFASNRVKERALRKPFNPMLGETYEVVRRIPDSDSTSFRFIAEKVTHHPVQMAWQADSLDGRWSVSQSPQPTQKFWGKSMELNTTGKVRVKLHEVEGQGSVTGERYSWTQATGFLRNIIAGEKYVEPVQSMTVMNEDTGHRAVATFKASGMFGGRSEEVTVAFYSPESQTALPLRLTGKWTTSLTRSDTNDKIWEAGPLIPDAGKVFGFTEFAAGLNEITAIEHDVCAPTDSRLRPDQRALEDGQLDQAEGTKAKLEERQRARRKILETHGKTHEPAFFSRCDVEEQNRSASTGDAVDKAWILRDGKNGYWQRRERGDWEGLVPVFEL